MKAFDTRVAEIAGRHLADAMREEAASLKLLTLQQAAELLGVSKPTVRRLLGEWIDLGAASPRVRLADVKELISKRSVKE